MPFHIAHYQLPNDQANHWRQGSSLGYQTAINPWNARLTRLFLDALLANSDAP